MGLRWRTEKDVVSGKVQYLVASRLCHTKIARTDYSRLVLTIDDEPLELLWYIREAFILSFFRQIRDSLSVEN